MVKQKQKPFFSIITVCYNEEKNIEKTCKSIFKQTLKNFEWIVIDGKSIDNTLNIIKKYNKCITSLVSERDDGIYNAMNKGIKRAKGEYVLFLNGGDQLKDKNVLQKVSDFIKGDNQKTNIYYGDMLYDDGELVSYKTSTLNEKFFIKKSISHQATFIKKNLLIKHKGYSEKYKIVSDYDFWIKTIIKEKAKTKYLPIVISIFDQNGMSSNYKLAKKQIKERTEVLMKYKLINKRQAIIAKIKWLFLTILKKIRIYKTTRRMYRRVIKR